MAARKFVWKNERILSHLFRSNPLPSIRPTVIAYSNNPSSKKADDIDNEPVPFSSSKAAQFKSGESEHTERPVFEPYIVRISLAAFLIYFCVLREESDWDNTVGASLFDSVPDMEVIMLRNKLKHATENDPFSEADRLRLQQLEKEVALR